MLGIILAVLCSNWVGEVIHSDGIYETDLDADGSVIFLRPSPPPALFAKDAGMIMSRAVWCAISITIRLQMQKILWHVFREMVRARVQDQSESAHLGWLEAEVGTVLHVYAAHGVLCCDGMLTPPRLAAKEGVFPDRKAADFTHLTQWRGRCFREIESVSYVTGVLRRTRHNGFPVVHGNGADPERDEGEFDELGCGASRTGPLEGVILRSQLLVLLGSQARACPESELKVSKPV